MKKIFLLITIFVASDPAWAGSDWEYWAATEVKAKVSEQVDFKVKPELKYKEDMSKHYSTETDIGFDWKAADQWILGLYYRHVHELKSDEWNFEHRPHLNAEYLWKWGALSFGNRGRVEFRNPEGLENTIRYRNRLTVKVPSVTKWKFQPYVSVEPFYDVDNENWNRVRSSLGITWGFTDNLKSELYWMNEQNEGAQEWQGKNVLGSVIKWHF